MKFHRNFKVDRPYAQPTYMDFDNVPFVKIMHQLHKENKLDSIQSLFFASGRIEEELYDLENDLYEVNNLAIDPNFKNFLMEHASILENWIKETNDQGQYPENEENLKLMLGIWEEYAINPEYDILRQKYKNLSGSQVALKRQKWKEVKN